MSGVRGIRNWRGWRKTAWLISGVTFCAVVAIVYFPNSLLNQRVAAGLTSYLVGQLGPEAICGEVELGWRYISLKDIQLPLDSLGTMLSIARIEVTVDLLTALAQPGEYERIVRSVNVVGPEFVLRLPDGQSASKSDALIPDEVFVTLTKVDSLRNFSFEGGKLTVLNDDTTLFVLGDIRGNLSNSLPGFVLIASGQSVTPAALKFRLTGDIWPADKSLDVTTTVTIEDDEIALSTKPLQAIGWNAGSVDIAIHQANGKSRVEGVAEFHAVELKLLDQSVFTPVARLTLRDGVVSWDSLVTLGFGADALLSGTINLQDSLRLSSEVEVNLNLESFFQAAFAQEGYNGKVRLNAVLNGTVASPAISAEVFSGGAVLAGQEVDSLLASVRYSRSALKIESCSLTNSFGLLSAQGGLKLTSDHAIEFEGIFRPRSFPKLLGQSSTIEAVEFTVDGSLEAPSLRWLTRDSLGALLGNGTAAMAPNVWTFTFADPSGKTGIIDVTSVAGEWSVKATNAHIAVPVVYSSTAQALSAVTQFEFDFTGNKDSGRSRLAILGDTLDRGMFSRILHQLEFDGSYQRNLDGAFDLNGNWHGVSGEGADFFGRGNIKLQNNVLTIGNLYVDEAGVLEGSVRIDTPWVDLKVSIEQLPLFRMPLVAGFAQEWKLAGMLSGEMSAKGPLDSLSWYADLSLVDGEAQGVPGYWGLLTAQGHDENVESLYSTFGRGVRSIFEVNGSVDIARNTLDLRADFPASDCADFIQALSGRSGILSGDLEGEILIFGKLTAPDIIARMRVKNGELLGELAVDQFLLDATVATEQDGSRLLAIPQLSFSKSGKYGFLGEFSTEPKTGGRFRGYFEGHGDFLDMLQQVDANFTSMGSAGTLRAEVGGTWDKPLFVGGEFTLTRGLFTYPPAAPGQLEMNAHLQLNSVGVVDSGRIQVNAGSDFLRVDFADREDSRAAGLEPLIIPGVGVELGVLVLSTAGNGMTVRLPGFMKPEWLGRLTTGHSFFDAITVSLFDSTRLRISGDASMRDARFTFPFISYGGSGSMRPVTKWLVDRLYETWWDLDITIGSGSHYDIEITGFKDSELYSRIGDNFLLGTVAEYLDHISVDAIVSPSEKPLVMKGAIVDSTLRLDGKLSATSGKADYLDQTFWIERLQAQFDETDIFPIISGRASTYGVDSVGRTVPVYLTIYEIDKETNSRLPYGRFEDVTYVLEADGYPNPEQVLALLGYDFTNLPEGKAEQLLTRTALSAAKRVWLDPISRKLERATFFDEISLAPGGGASPSIFRQQRESILRDTLQTSGVVRFFTGSNVTVGKYISRDVFVTYTGELAEAAGEVKGGRLGLIHYWNLQYRVVPLSLDFVLDFAVEYDEASRRRDESVALKYSFVLEP